MHWHASIVVTGDLSTRWCSSKEGDSLPVFTRINYVLQIRSFSLENRRNFRQRHVLTRTYTKNHNLIPCKQHVFTQINKSRGINGQTKKSFRSIPSTKTPQVLNALLAWIPILVSLTQTNPNKYSRHLLLPYNPYPMTQPARIASRWRRCNAVDEGASRGWYSIYQGEPEVNILRAYHFSPPKRLHAPLCF